MAINQVIAKVEKSKELPPVWAKMLVKLNGPTALDGLTSSQKDRFPENVFPIFKFLQIYSDGMNCPLFAWYTHSDIDAFATAFDQLKSICDAEHAPNAKDLSIFETAEEHIHEVEAFATNQCNAALDRARELKSSSADLYKKFSVIMDHLESWDFSAIAWAGKSATEDAEAEVGKLKDNTESLRTCEDILKKASDKSLFAVPEDYRSVEPTMEKLATTVVSAIAVELLLKNEPKQNPACMEDMIDNLYDMAAELGLAKTKLPLPISRRLETAKVDCKALRMPKPSTARPASPASGSVGKRKQTSTPETPTPETDSQKRKVV